MDWLHVIMAVLAAGRLTEVITQDRITDWFRNKWPTYLWTCPRCVSVWAGMWCTVMAIYFPFGNWPLALSWAYLLIGDLKVGFQNVTAKPGIRIIPYPEGAQMDWGGFDPRIGMMIIHKISQASAPQQDVSNDHPVGSAASS